MRFTLDLQDFLLRARVLKLYRHALRITKKAPVDTRGELRKMIREEMENNRNSNDRQKIKFLISEGLKRLKGLDETLDMQGRIEGYLEPIFLRSIFISKLTKASHSVMVV